MKRLNNISINNRGFTLVEVMMTLLIFGVVLGVVANVFFTTQGLYGRTTQRADQQMNTRAGLSVMVAEIRRAGADPNNESINALGSAHQDTVRVRTEMNDTAGLQTDEPSEDVLYFYDVDQGTVFRDPGTGPQPMITNVTNFSLQFFDSNNNVIGPTPLTLTMRDQVRSIGINVTTETPGGGEMVVSTRVGLRNR